MTFRKIKLKWLEICSKWERRFGGFKIKCRLKHKSNWMNWGKKCCWSKQRCNPSTNQRSRTWGTKTTRANKNCFRNWTQHKTFWTRKKMPKDWSRPNYATQNKCLKEGHTNTSWRKQRRNNYGKATSRSTRPNTVKKSLSQSNWC